MRLGRAVDPRFDQGPADKVSGGSHLGRTAGWQREADDSYEKHDAPKQKWVRERVKKACVKLRAPELRRPGPGWKRPSPSLHRQGGTDRQSDGSAARRTA